jgi:hypothetical protein
MESTRTRATLFSAAIVTMTLAFAPLAAGAQDEAEPEGSLAPQAAPEPLPAGTGPLEPGTYITEALGPSLTFTVGDGWSIGGEAVEGVGVDLVPDPYSYDGPEDRAALGITRSDGEVFEGYCVPAGGDYEAFNQMRTSIEPTAQALADHLAANPYLETSEPVPVEIGGHSGLQLDATASVGDDCEIPVTFLWAIPVFDNWVLTDGDQGRYHLIDVDGEVVAFVLEGGADVDMEDLASLARPVIDSMILEPM